MKYIRTKDMILTNEEYGEYFNAIEIIKQADTIEELCDEFVHGRMVFRTLKECLDYAPLGGIIYGAIWTDKGLIYVAKMNDKGELELL